MGVTAVHVGLPSVLWEIPSVLLRLFSTVGDRISTVPRPPSPCFRPSSYFSTLPTHFYPLDSLSICCSIHSILRRFSTVEVVQYIGGYSVHRGNNISTVGDALVLWRLRSTVGDNISTVGITSVLWRVFSSVA